MGGPRDEKTVSGGHGQGHATRSGRRRTRTGPRDARRSAADTDRATRREAVSGGHGQGHATGGVSGGHGRGHATRSGQRRIRTQTHATETVSRRQGHATRKGQQWKWNGPRHEKRSVVDWKGLRNERNG